MYLLGYIVNLHNYLCTLVCVWHCGIMLRFCSNVALLQLCARCVHIDGCLLKALTDTPRSATAYICICYKRERGTNITEKELTVELEFTD